MAKKSRNQFGTRDHEFKKLLKRWKRKLEDNETLEEYKERRYYTKPTTARRKQKLQAIRENEWEVQKQKENE